MPVMLVDKGQQPGTTEVPLRQMLQLFVAARRGRYAHDGIEPAQSTLVDTLRQGLHPALSRPAGR